MDQRIQICGLHRGLFLKRGVLIAGYGVINYLSWSTLKQFYIRRAIMGSPHQQSFGLQWPENSGWWRISSDERCYLRHTCTVHHGQGFTWWWIRRKLHRVEWWIWALYPGRSSTWHQERLGALSPIYQGTIVVFHHCIHALSQFPPPVGNHSPETWPFKCVVMDKVRAVLRVCVRVCVCVWLKHTPQRQSETSGRRRSTIFLSLRSHSSETDLTLENRCGITLTLDGSKALLCPGSHRRSAWTNYAYCKADRCGTQGSPLCPQPWAGISLCECLCVLWPLKLF